jgi:molybdopterin converting factor small subunit
MYVIVKFLGPLSEQTGQETVSFSLNQRATYGHLLDEIGKRFGHCFHERLWDADRKIFKAGILAVGAGRDLDSREIPLQDGEEIKIVPLLGGG